jgi:hypothetical protein
MSKPLNAIRPQFSPSRIEDSLGDPIPGFIDDLEAVYDVEMIFPKLSEGKVCSFSHLAASLK